MQKYKHYQFFYFFGCLDLSAFSSITSGFTKSDLSISSTTLSLKTFLRILNKLK